MIPYDKKGRFIKGFKSPTKHQVSLFCFWCKNQYSRKKSRVKGSRFCSRRCCAKWIYEFRLKQKFIKGMSQEKNPAWKGGRQKIRGYVMISIGKKKRKQEHRIIMEEILGRKLSSIERVHHKNGVKDDNRPENLELCFSQSEHMRKYHA